MQRGGTLQGPSHIPDSMGDTGLELPPEGGQQGNRERGLESGPVSLPLMQGHSLLGYCLVTLASSPCLLWVDNCYRNSPIARGCFMEARASVPSGSEIIQPQGLKQTAPSQCIFSLTEASPFRFAVLAAASLPGCTGCSEPT